MVPRIAMVPRNGVAVDDEVLAEQSPLNDVLDCYQKALSHKVRMIGDMGSGSALF